MHLKTMKIIALSAVLALCALAADVSGAWTAKMEGRQGRSEGRQGRSMEMTFNLKASGDQLTGTVSGPRGGEMEISDGKVMGDKVSFKVKREFQGRSMVMNYEGTVSGDEIHFKQSTEGSDRPGREFTARRK